MWENNSSNSNTNEMDLELEDLNQFNPMDQELQRLFPEKGGQSITLNNFGNITNINIISHSDMYIKAEDSPILDLERLERIDSSNNCQNEMKEFIGLQSKLKFSVHRLRNNFPELMKEIKKEIINYILEKETAVMNDLIKLDNELGCKIFQDDEIEDISKRLNMISSQTMSLLNDFMNLK
jgi:hypothetical protein